MIRVNEEFKKLIPPLSIEEYKQLERNIIIEGCRDALVVWDEMILDGHNRYEICTKHNIEYRVHVMEFDTEDEALDWMDKNQLGRRNLTPDQMSMIRGRMYNRMKKAQGSNNQYVQDKSEKGQIDTFQNTASILAKQHGVSEHTIRRDGAAAEKRAQGGDHGNQYLAKDQNDTLITAEKLDQNEPAFNPLPYPGGRNLLQVNIT